MRLGAGVIDVAIQHPLPLLRLELLRLLLDYNNWCWDMCGPVAVAAAVGDTDVLQALLQCEEMDPNVGFPLRVAVLSWHHHDVLPLLLQHHRIDLNFGSAFDAAVRCGNIEAMNLLGATTGVNVNVYAANEGTFSLNHSIRRYLGSSSQRGGEAYSECEQEEAQGSSGVPFAVDEKSSGASQVGLPRVTKSLLTTPVISRLPEAEERHQSYAAPSLGKRSRQLLSSPVDDDRPARFSSAAHWRSVLLYLLNHPAIEVNLGYSETPLYMAVRAADHELIGWLLQHPRLNPNRTPKSVQVLRSSTCCLDPHHTASRALQQVVASPLELTFFLKRVRTFALLIRDRRVEVPTRLVMRLERTSLDHIAIPYLTALAVIREDWEGFGWRWRRRCLTAAVVGNLILSLCIWIALFWSSAYLRAAARVLCLTSLAGVVMTWISFYWLRRKAAAAVTASPAARARAAASTSLSVFLQHQLPHWSARQRQFLMVALLSLPSIVPALDCICLWNMRQALALRHPLPSRAESRLSSPSANVFDQPDTEVSCWREETLDCCSTSVAVESAIKAPPRAALRSRHPPKTLPRVEVTGNESTWVVGRQLLSAESLPLAAAVQMPSVRVPGGSSSPVVEDGVAASAPMASVLNRLVVPGQPSSFALVQEYSAPDLVRRGLAYTSFDVHMTGARLLLSLVSLFVFLFLIFAHDDNVVGNGVSAAVGGGEKGGKNATARVKVAVLGVAGMTAAIFCGGATLAMMISLRSMVSGTCLSSATLNHAEAVELQRIRDRRRCGLTGTEYDFVV